MEKTNKQHEVYMLLHVYDLARYNMAAKLIGIYSNRKNAQDEAKRYMELEGFRDYPYSCFRSRYLLLAGGLYLPNDPKEHILRYPSLGE